MMTACVWQAYLAVMMRLGSAPSQANLASRADALMAAYGGPSRFYHGLDHIEAMLDGLDRHRSLCANFDAVAAAILFHDVVYDAKRSDNEAASAAWARRDLSSMGADSSTILRAETLILATRHDVTVPSSDGDMALLVDLDLAVLAAEPAAYDVYATSIRREYAHVPDDAYRIGRAKVLQGFLAKPQIYATAMLRDLWEGRARINLEREIARLTS